MKYSSIAAFTLFLFACHGWGYALVRRAAARDKNYFAFLSVVGIAFLVFLGGVLNLARLAYPAALGILLLSGLIFSAICFSKNTKEWLAAWRASSLFSPGNLKPMLGHLLPTCILITAVCFYALTLLPAATFNFADDFQTYIPRPLRMLQTGTMVGNPYDVLGVDLGAHAFLHGFVLLGFPIEYLLGFDAVFCFALAGWLLISIGKKFNLHWSYTAFALLGFIVINPQSVNVSAVYTGSAIILGILFASLHLLDQLEKSGTDAIPIIEAGILGLLLAGVVAIKASFASYAFAYPIFFFAGLLAVSEDKRRILKIAGIVMSGIFVALLPWLALNATNYLQVSHAALPPSTVATNHESLLSMSHDVIELFSTKNLIYGGSFLSYGIIVLMLFLLGSYSLFNAFGSRVAPSRRGYFLVAAASCAAGVVSYFFNGFTCAPTHAVRYSCPVLIAILPFAWLAASMAVSDTLRPARSVSLPGVKMAIILSMPLLVIVLFWSNFVERIERAYYKHITLSFHVEDAYIEHYRHVASPETRQVIRGIQLEAQPGQKILAWIDMPGHLDFSRNEIYSVRDYGLVNPWVNMPLDGNVVDMVQYLRGQGIRYIMWEYEGFGMVRIYNQYLTRPYKEYQIVGERAIYLRKMLALIMKGGSFLYNADGIVLFDLQQVK